MLLIRPYLSYILVPPSFEGSFGTGSRRSFVGSSGLPQEMGSFLRLNKVLFRVTCSIDFDFSAAVFFLSIVSLLISDVFPSIDLSV